MRRFLLDLLLLCLGVWFFATLILIENAVTH